MKPTKCLSVLLAGVLQVIPVARAVIAVSPAAGVNYAIISTWIAGALALMGGTDSVSGASTVINSPTTATGTNGVAFSYRITTGPQVANTFAASPLPPGLTVSTTSGRITGTPTATGSYTVRLTASDNGRADRTVTANLALTILPPVTIVTPPTITSQPSSQTVNVGSNASFSVGASGSGTLAYQWRRNGSNISGATNSSLSLTSVTTNNAGNYTAVVSNSGGSVTSSVAVLTITVPVIAPSITTQPASQTVNVGANVSFSVTATGTAPLSYQWRYNGSPISGAISSTLALNSVTTNQAGAYSVVVSNSAGTVASGNAGLTVNVPVVAPAITTQPASQTVVSGGSVTFGVTATGTGPLSYQWRFNGSPISGATSSTLTLSNVTTNDAGAYSVLITNIANSILSSTANLAVTALAVAPSIITQPVSQTVNGGANVTFTAVAGGTGPLNYQWKFNGNNIVGATASSLVLNSVSTNDAGSYSLAVSNSVGGVASSSATLTVNVPVGNTAPVISAIADLTMEESSTSSTILFNVGDTQTSVTALTLTKSSADTMLIPNAGIALGGSGSNRTVTITPSSGKTGSAVVSITVSDGSLSATTSFVVTVQAANTNPPSMLFLSTHGHGNVTPNLHGQNLVLGRKYTIRAVPDTGYEFAGWTGGVDSHVATLSFVMTSNLVLDAAFVPSPFIPTAGAYNGLFHEEEEIRLRSSGCFKLQVSPKGMYSGTIQFADGRHSISGKFDLDCRATNTVTRKSGAILTVEIALGTNEHTGEISGRISDGVFDSALSGARNDFNVATNPAPQAGRYTFAISGRKGDIFLPAGDGIGSMRVMSNGVAMFTGVLADGARVVRSATMTPDGAWPFFAALYSGRGSAISWFTFEDSPESDVDGSLVWIKEANSSARYYPLGFTNETKVAGSIYTFPIGSVATPVLDLPVALVSFEGGDLATDFANEISIGYYSQVSNLSSNALKLTFSTATGLFTGNVTDPGTGARLKFRGAALQKQNGGAGFMLGTSQSSLVHIAGP